MMQKFHSIKAQKNRTTCPGILYISQVIRPDCCYISQVNRPVVVIYHSMEFHRFVVVYSSNFFERNPSCFSTARIIYHLRLYVSTLFWKNYFSLNWKSKFHFETPQVEFSLHEYQLAFSSTSCVFSHIIRWCRYQWMIDTERSN